MSLSDSLQPGDILILDEGPRFMEVSRTKNGLLGYIFVSDLEDDLILHANTSFLCLKPSLWHDFYYGGKKHFFFLVKGMIIAIGDECIDAHLKRC